MVGHHPIHLPVISCHTPFPTLLTALQAHFCHMSDPFDVPLNKAKEASVVAS